MKKYLPLYYEWMETGLLPHSGLCRCLNVFNDNKLFNLVTPDSQQGYWAYWHEFRKTPLYTQDVSREMSMKLQYSFNPLRQNILLFLAAMNGELK
jgi:hypothetical protein